MTKDSTLPGNDHYIIAIGASAGGLEAIHEFFDNMPSNGNLSFVIIQHLSPDYKSLLVELVSKHTNMMVFEAEHGKKAERNCVYVIPNNKLLTIKDGYLQLGIKNFEKAPNTAIDTFLNSLAADRGTKAIAIILSGTGSDGSRGIEAIRNQGGMVLVQDPLTAKFDGMPNTAIATGYADYILAPELMPEEIFNYIKERPVRIAKDGGPDEALLPEVLKLVDKHCHYDFYNYKTPTILRRIGRRMGLAGYKNFAEYIEFLRRSPEECRLLGQEFLIGVTKFFRDEAAFKILKNEVLPELVAAKEDGDVMKVWVAACSTGEEAYSIAILIDDYLQSSGRSIEVKIFATDIDIEAIDFASKGTYPLSSLVDIEERLARKYFSREGNHAIVHPRLRKQIVFARHNILKDPPFIKNDLVSCRNMLIYMNNILQNRIFSIFQFALNKGGFLFLGPSETPASIKKDLSEISSKWKIFRKISSDSSYNPERLPATQNYRMESSGPVAKSPKENILARDLSEDFRSMLIEEYGFAAIYVDNNLEVKEAVGDFRKYLSLPDRINNLQILKMVSNDLSIALHAAIRKAGKDKVPVNLHHQKIRQGDKNKYINIFIKPSSRNENIMIVLGESNDINLSGTSPQFSTQHSAESVNYITELEEELKETRYNLQMAVEGLETANEELQSSNEELLSANEELQSSNEELQSLNEELHTLNTEHQMRIRELIELNDDLNNYFRSTEIAQVFVDSNLRIRKFNPVAVKMINLIDSDLGRPIEHISTNISNNNKFLEDIKYVLETENIVEKEVQLSNGSTHLMKTIPYLRQDKKVDGVVITLIDISNIKELDNIIRGVFNASLSAIMAFKAVRNNEKELKDLRWIASNHSADDLLGRSKKDYMGKLLSKEFPELLKKDLLKHFEEVISSGTAFHKELQLTFNNNKQWYEIVATQMMDGVVMNITNINDKRNAEEKLKENYQELMKVKENYRNLSIDLEEKVKERTFDLSKSEERFRLIANATSDAIWDWDLLNDKIWWSDNFYSRFGHSRDESSVKAAFRLEHIHPDDREKVRQTISNAINNIESFWTERYRFRKSDGSYAIILDKGTVLTDAAGIPFRMVGAMMDITETVEAEREIRAKNEELQLLIQEFKFVTDFMPQMVWSTRADGYHDFYNKGWFDYTGLSYEETKNKGWALVLHPDDAEKTWEVWKESLQTGKTYETEYRMRKYNGEYRWFLARAIPLKNQKGEIIKWFGTCTDVHDQKIMSDVLEQKVIERTLELQKINHELENSNNELLQFASVASHDLKEPLRKIHLFSNLVKDRHMQNASEGALDYMNRIIAASARMSKLINDLLSFTRLAGDSRFEKADLNFIVEEVLSDLELSIQESGAVIEVCELPEMEIVTGQMRQVFQNIISNALKFVKKEERPVVKIKCDLVENCSINSPVNNKGNFCRIEICDNGIGFDDQYADKIFTIFQRLHSREKYDGTGIGLAITKKIIERHHGLITARGGENSGACFIMVLPLNQPHQSEKEIAGSKAEEVRS